MAQLRHIAMIVKEPPRLFDYYQRLFGVEQVRLSPTGSIHVVDPLFNLAFLQYTGGDVEVVGTHRADGTEANQTPGVNHFGFIVDNLDEVLSRLPKDIQFGESPQNGRPAEMRVIDPWGNNFDLSTRGFLGREEERLPGVRFAAVHNERPEEMAAFYREVLDLRETRRQADGSIHLSDGAVTLAVTPEQVLNRTGIQYFGVQVPSWPAIAPKFAEIGAELPKPTGATDEVWVRDPEDNLYVISAEGW